MIMIFFKPLNGYLGRNIYKFYSLDQSNFITILMTVQNENFRQKTDLEKKWGGWSPSPPM